MKAIIIPGNDEGHFGEDVNKKEFPEIITVVSKMMQRQKIKL